MTEFQSSLSPKGQITLPRELRRKWKLKPRDRIAIRIEGDTVTLTPVQWAVDASFGAVPLLPARLRDADQTALAADEHAEEIAREGLAEQP